MKMNKDFVSHLSYNLQHLALSLLTLVIVLGFVPTVGAKSYKGAEVYTTQAQLYGKYDIRMRAAKGSGITSTFFLWKEGAELPDVPWEEVDIEVFGKDNAQAWQSNIITGQGERITSEQVHSSMSSFADDYHTFTIEWTPDQVRWLVDGELQRITIGEQASDLMSPVQARINFWSSTVASWVGEWNDEVLPLNMFINWIEFSSWNGQDFEPSWRDDFNDFNQDRWGVANWTFDDNRVDFSPLNVTTRDGYLVLSMTKEGQEGYTGVPPIDTADEPSSDEASPPKVGEDIKVDMSITSDWSRGYCAALTLTNTTDSAVDWAVSIPVEGSVYNLWNGVWSQTDSILSLSGGDSNNLLLTGQVDNSIGFCATR